MPTITTPLERKLFDALNRIAKQYDTSARIVARSEQRYGLPGIEALMMSYDNIKQEARSALRNVRLPKQPHT